MSDIQSIRRDARFSAQAALEAYWPEGTLPVDPAVIASRMGVDVYEAPLEPGVFGVIVNEDGATRIYLEPDQSLVRFRFTCAHELGHYVQNTALLVGGTGFVDRRSDDTRGNPGEVWANEFAGSLLMPEDALREMDGLSVFEQAAKFKVSVQALEYRRNLLAA